MSPITSVTLTVCKKEECAHQSPPECPGHRELLAKKTKCCDAFECACNCRNSTHTCPAGFITSSSTNDCGCTETSCLPDKVSARLDRKDSFSLCRLLLKRLVCSSFLPLQVCVVGGVVHPLGSEWEQGCERCSCTQLQDKDTSLHIAQCIPPACDRTCPQVKYTKHTSITPL